ncbi:ankyrin repeat domain-containing protein 17-like [Haliotis asinina]|uniref:ankyrin repeat domain-containing protein 17-like n=1 Tax=Haliotis asinina TaxID=109174 RepID=UPI0035319927
MEVSTIILLSLLVCGVKAIDTDDSLAALVTRVRLMEGEIQSWKLTAVNSEIKLMNKIEVLESSLKEELTGRFLPPLIKPLVKLAISDIMKGDYIGNIISGHVLEEVQALKASGQHTKTKVKALAQQLRRVERERDSYRESLQKQRNRLTNDIRAFHVQLNHTVADLRHARMLKSELNKTNDDLCDTRRKVIGLTEDFIALNTSSVMMRNEVESCMNGLEEIRLKLPTDIQSLTTQLNQTKEELLDTKEVMNRLTEDVMTLNVSCGIRKEMRPNYVNGSSLTTSSLSQLSHTTLNTTFPGTAAALTDPTPSNTVPPAPRTTQDSDLHKTPIYMVASATDASEDPTPSSTVSPAPEMTQDPDAHATPSPAAGRDLSSASEGGDLERVKRILAAGHVDINYRRGDYSSTPVMEASVNGHRDVVEFLVGRGADVSLVDRFGDNVLHLACYGGDLETVKLILSLNVVGINSRGEDSWTPVMAAAYNEHRDLVKFLVGRGADVSLVDGDGSNFLHYACREGHLETVKLILSLNVVGINSRGEDSWTPVMAAAYNEHRALVKFLVGRGADVSLTDSDGNNVLHYACREGHLETVKLILSLDVVDVNARNKKGRTGADWARHGGHQRVLDLLVSQGSCKQIVMYARLSGKKRSYEVHPVRTLEFQSTIQKICQERGDEWAQDVQGKLEMKYSVLKPVLLHIKELLLDNFSKRTSFSILPAM